MKTKDQITILENIVDITKTIYKIFANLLKNYEKNDTLYNQNLDYLKMALKLENKLYMQLDEEDFETLTLKLLAILERKNISKKDYEIIKNRIIFTLNFKTLQYPFLCTIYYDNELNKTENLNSIQTYFSKEFTYNKLYFLMQKIKTAPNKSTKKELYKSYLTQLFYYKVFDEYIFSPVKDIHTNGRNQLLLYKHNPKIIESVYRDIILNVINNSIENCQDIELLNIKNKQAHFDLQIIQIQSAFSLLSTQEKREIYNSFINNKNKDTFIEITPKSFYLIKKTFEDFNIIKPKILKK